MNKRLSKWTKPRLLMGLLILLGGAFALLSSCTSSSTYQRYSAAAEASTTQALPAHYGPSGFTNPYTDGIDKNAFDFFAMRWFGDDPWADQSQELNAIETTTITATNFEPMHQHRATWLGHATFIVEIAGVRIVTDPIVSERASPFSFAGPERLTPAPLPLSAWPQLDAIVISHNHYDHLDADTMRQLLELQPQLQVIVPLGLAPWLREQGYQEQQIVELDWWEQTRVGSVTITATPSQHWSARSLGDRMQSLWASWYFTSPQKRVWFAGDTGYNPYQFNEIRSRLGAVDLALVPIGAYQPRWFMQPQHTNPQEAVQLHLDLGAKQSIAMHFGTYQLAAESLAETYADFDAAKQAAGAAAEGAQRLPIGGQLIF